MNDDPFHGFQPPEPPPGLGEEVLRAARRRFSESSAAAAPDVWLRLYRSRTARFAWAASVVFLAALHLALPQRPAAAPPSTVSAPRLDPEVGAIARLPRISEQAASAYSGERS